MSNLISKISEMLDFCITIRAKHIIQPLLIFEIFNFYIMESLFKIAQLMVISFTPSAIQYYPNYGFIMALYHIGSLTISKYSNSTNSLFLQLLLNSGWYFATSYCPYIYASVLLLNFA